MLERFYQQYYKIPTQASYKLSTFSHKNAQTTETRHGAIRLWARYIVPGLMNPYQTTLGSFFRSCQVQAKHVYITLDFAACSLLVSSKIINYCAPIYMDSSDTTHSALKEIRNTRTFLNLRTGPCKTMGIMRFIFLSPMHTCWNLVIMLVLIFLATLIPILYAVVFIDVHVRDLVEPC